MNIRPIKNDEDHRRALRRVEELMDAKPDTPEGDELDVLATLVEAYEDRHFPIDGPDFPLYNAVFPVGQARVARAGDAPP